MPIESLQQVAVSLKSSASAASSAALSSSLQTSSSTVGHLSRPQTSTTPSLVASPTSGLSLNGDSIASGKLSGRRAHYMKTRESAPISAPLRTSSSNLPSLLDSSTALPSKTTEKVLAADITISSSTSSLPRLLADRDAKRNKTGKKKLFSGASERDDCSQVVKGIYKSKIRENHSILGKILATLRNVLRSALVTLNIRSAGNDSNNFTGKGNLGNNGTMSSTLAALLSNQYSKVTSGFQSLQSSPSELWKAYLLKFLDSYAYFSFSLIFTIFLSHEFGMSDVRAGTIYGAWGALITVFGLVTGTIIDNLGVAKCLRIGFSLSFLTRLTLFFCTSETVLLFCTLVALPLANCLGIPVLTVGIRRYTNDENRGFAFGLFYVIMNVGALVAGPLVDVLTIFYKGGGSSKGDDDVGNDDNDDAAMTGSTSDWAMTTNRAIILSGVVANFFAVFVAFSVREIKVDANAKKSTPLRNTNGNKQAALVPTEEPVDDLNGNGNVDDLGSERDIGVNDNAASSSPKVTQFQPIKGSTLQILSETVRTPNFRRFLLVCLLTLNVRMVFRHLDGTLPKYMMREFGPDTPKGMVYSINPALIIVLVPIITAATSTVPPLVMIHRGTYVSALSVFFLALSTSLPACILFVITLSIGEALWSPRLYDFTMSVAQEGREGTYMALSSAPLFLAKLPVGFLSGLLLQRYCPETLEDGEVRHSKTMWWIIGLSTIISPIMITVLWGYVSGGERSRSDSDAGTPGTRGIAMRIKDGERGVQDDDDVYGYSDQRDLFQNDEDLESKTESPYQHRPLTTNLSLPRVRASERALT